MGNGQPLNQAEAQGLRLARGCGSFGSPRAILAIVTRGALARHLTPMYDCETKARRPLLSCAPSPFPEVDESIPK